MDPTGSECNPQVQAQTPAIFLLCVLFRSSSGSSSGQELVSMTTASSSQAKKGQSVATKIAKVSVPVEAYPHASGPLSLQSPYLHIVCVTR